jgi:xanthine/uracil permease
MQRKSAKSTKSVDIQRSAIKLRYGLDDRLPLRETLLYSVQWLALSLPFVVIIGTVAATHHFSDLAQQTLYLQKATFATGLMLLGQALSGHRLTLVGGPATVLLLGIVESRASPDAIYTAIAVCGVLLAIVSALNLFSALRALFTPRVTATMVLLIAFTVTPMIVGLLTAGDAETSVARLAFATGFILVIFLTHRLLPPAGRSLLIVAGMVAGTALFSGLFGIEVSTGHQEIIALFFSGMTTPSFDIGTILSFFFCFIALSLNEIGSIQSVTPLLQPDGMEGRIRRGMAMTGIINACAGLLGAIGPIDYSLSPGAIAASGCGSRRPIFLTAAILLLVSFSPLLLGLAEAMPSTVIAGVLIYTLSGQIASGLTAAFSSRTFTFDDGLVIGLPLLAGTVVAQFPPAIIDALPAILRPVAGNGFVIGVIAVLMLDRIFRLPAQKRQ